MIWKQFYYSIRSLFKPNRHQEVPLGRWNWKKCNSEKNLYLANIDSCGDKLCGNMVEVKKIMKKFIEFV